MEHQEQQQQQQQSHTHPNEEPRPQERRRGEEAGGRGHEGGKRKRLMNYIDEQKWKRDGQREERATKRGR